MSKAPDPLPRATMQERALLGGVLQQPDWLAYLRQTVHPDDFWDRSHAALWSLLCAMSDAGEAIDLVTVPERISRTGAPEDYGGVAYVLELSDEIPSTSNLEDYADRVSLYGSWRSLIQECQSAVRLAQDGPRMIEEGEPVHPSAVRDRIAANLLGSTASRGSKTWAKLGEVAGEVVDAVEEPADASTDRAVATGITTWDRDLGALFPTDLVILAARPAMGKTTLALQIAENAGWSMDVAVFSLEMGARQLTQRRIAALSGVPYRRLRYRNELEPEDYPKIMAAAEKLRSSRVWIDDSSELTIADLASRARRLAATAPDLGLIVVDYVQLMHGEDPRASRDREIGRMSRGLKALAKDLNVPVLCLSQLSRKVEMRENRRPVASDLRESGSLEQDADMLSFLFRPEYYWPDGPDYQKGVCEVICAKNRHGPTRDLYLKFDGAAGGFSTLPSSHAHFQPRPKSARKRARP